MVFRKNQKLYDDDLISILALFISGMNYSEIARKYDVSRQTIGDKINRIHRNKIKLDLSKETRDQLSDRITQ